MPNTSDVDKTGNLSPQEAMFPAQIAMSEARAEALSHEENLAQALEELNILDSGVTPQYAAGKLVQMESIIAGEKARATCEALENENPIKRIERALVETAETEEEIHNAQRKISNLAGFRSFWEEKIKSKMAQARMAKEPFNLRSAISVTAYYTKSRMVEGEPVLFVPLEVLDSGYAGKPRSEQVDNFLRFLGVLDKDQKVEDLRYLPAPSAEDDSAPRYTKLTSTTEGATQLQTNILGVEADVWFDHMDARVTLFFSESALAKTIGLEVL